MFCFWSTPFSAFCFAGEKMKKMWVDPKLVVFFEFFGSAMIPTGLINDA